MTLINKYISIVYRISQKYFDDTLTKYNIGSGQQFFLLHINDNPGISQFDLSIVGHFDKSTTARAVKKLEELGYIRREVDTNDQRLSHLYSTPTGDEVVLIVHKMLEDWHKVLNANLEKNELELADKLMQKMAMNAITSINERKKE